MKSREANEASAHRFFHAMVVMGGSVALGCGGATTGDETGEPDTSGSGGNEAPDDDDHVHHAGGFHMGGTDGEHPVPTGGTTSTGGTIAVGGAGAVGAGGASWDQGPAECPSTEWTCGDTYLNCGRAFVGVQVPNGCECDAARPQSASECPPGDVFVCRNGIEGSDGIPLGTPLPFDCTCVAAGPDCNACRVAYGSWGDSYECSLVVREAGSQDVLCGCAVVILR